ncbi:ATP-grasp domain-containing protein [Candidatus Giovannonibacteria bacterium]|nr:ATP-grasp domain-containing protein [Candidatus Giovannonibacteria bacterium]
MTDAAKKVKVGIIFGGSSSEKEVSLEGGRNVFQKIDTSKYDIFAIFMDSKHRIWKIPEFLLLQNTTSDIERLLATKGERIFYEELKSQIDFAFIIGHGKFMEDGCLQGLLELQKIPYNGPGILGSALGSEKYIQRKILDNAGIKTPKHLALFEDEWRERPEIAARRIEDYLGFPVVVKPSREGCSTAIGIVAKAEDLPQAFSAAFHWDRRILVEEKITGMEITISVLGNRASRIALPITETPWSKNLGYLTLQDKFLPGGAEMITPARLSLELTARAQEIAIKVCDELNLIGYPRIDMFVKEDGEIVVLEPNTLPGITPSTMVFHQAAEVGMNPADFLDKIIALGIEAHAKKIGPL